MTPEVHWLFQGIFARSTLIVAAAVIAAIVLSFFLVTYTTPLNVLVAVAGAIVAIICLRFPGIAFAAYLYIPFYKGALQPMLPVDLTVVLAIGCTGLAFIHVKRVHWRSATRVLWGWAALLVVVSVGALYAENSEIATNVLVSFISLMSLPLLLGIVVGSDAEFRRQFLFASAGLSLLVVSLGTISLGALAPLGRLEVLGSNTVGTSRAALILPVILIGGWVGASRWVRRWSLLLIPLSVLIAFATGSRGPLISFAVAILAVKLPTRKRAAQLIPISLFAVALAWSIAQLELLRSMLPTWSTERIVSLVGATFGGESLDSSGKTRLYLWELAWQMFMERPWIGFGTGSFASRIQAIPGGEDFAYPHNLPLQFAAEFGLVGLTALMVLLLPVVRQITQRHNGMDQAVVALALFAFVNAMFSNSIYDNRWLWGMIIIVASMPLAQRELTSTSHASTEMTLKGPVRGAGRRSLAHNSPVPAPPI